MSSSGVKSTNVTSRPRLSDHVVVNRDGSTGLQSTGDLAVQLAASGAVAEGLSAAYTASQVDVSRAKKAQLDAVFDDYPVGATGQVLFDTDELSGRYERGVSAWIKRGPLPVDAAEAWAADAEISKDDARASKNAASSYAASALSSEMASAVSEANALAYRQDARAAAEASGSNVTFFDTKALANAGLAGVPANGIVEVFTDETRGNARTRYRKESGVLVFKTVAGIDIDDTMTASFSAAAPVVLRQIVEQFITPDLFGSVHGSDDSLALLKARDSAAALGSTLTLPRGTYTLSETMELQSDMGLSLLPGARLRAKSGFSGNSLVRVGNVGDSGFTENVVISGGILDAANNVDMALDVAYGRFSRIDDLRLVGGNINGLRVGDPSAPGASYEIDARNVKAYYNDVANSVSSAGIRHQYATDCYGNQLQVIGYRTGFLIDGYSIELSQAHAWSRPVHGAMRRAFDIQGGSATLFQCYADTPNNYGRPEITDLVGFYLHGFGPTLQGCRVFMNTNYPGADVSTDGLVSALHMDREVFGLIGGMSLSGATASRRWRTFLGGGFGSQSVIDPHVDGGAVTFVDASTRGGNRVAQPETFRGAMSLLSTLNVSGAAQFDGFLSAKAGLSVEGGDILRRGNAGTNRDFQFFTSTNLRWGLRANNDPETGSEAGSNFGINAYTDSGSFLRSQMLMNRATGLTRFGGPLGSAGYAFAALPGAGSFTGCIVYVTDRSNRPAYSNGSAWKWVSDDANVS